MYVKIDLVLMEMILRTDVQGSLEEPEYPFDMSLFSRDVSRPEHCFDRAMETRIALRTHLRLS